MTQLPGRVAMSLFAILLTANVFAKSPADESSAAQKQKEAAFEQEMANTTLTGAFTVDGKLDAAPKPESYEIESVKKLGGGIWTFTTRVKYGEVDVKLPINVPVIWAGDTPVVCLTNASIPGMGEGFSARVVFYDNRYAGTWQHGKKGGHLYGTIAKSKANAKATTATETTEE